MTDVKILLCLILCVGLLVVSTGAPINDLCESATVITDSANSQSSIAVDVTDATTTVGDPIPSCLASDSTTSRSIWWTFTPSATGIFTISTCNSSSLPNTVLLVLTGSCGAFSEVARGCSDNECVKQSSVTVSLTSGTGYYIVVYSGSDSVPVADANVVVLTIQRGGTFLPAAPNDKCNNAITVTANSSHLIPTGYYWTNDYTVDVDCYSRKDAYQVLDPAKGGDVVFKFVAPALDSYNFKVISYPSLGRQDVGIFLARNCPAGTQVPYPNCGAVNRRTDRFIDMYDCFSMAQGETVLIFVDLLNPDGHTLADTSLQYFLEISPCNAASADSTSPGAATSLTCGMTGGIERISAIDQDYFQFNPVALGEGYLIFALVDGGPATTGAFDVTLVTVDDDVVTTFPNDNYPLWGSASSSIVGYRVTGAAVNYYLRIGSSQDTDIPYQIWAWVEPPNSFPNPELEPNDSLGKATPLGQYGIGQLSNGIEYDYWSIQVPLIGNSVAVMTACIAPVAGQSNLASNIGLSFRSSSGSIIISVAAGSRGRCINIRPLEAGQYYFSVEAGGSPGQYILAASFDCNPANQAAPPSTPISGLPMAPTGPVAPLSLVLPVAPLSGPMAQVSSASRSNLLFFPLLAFLYYYLLL